MSSCTCHLGTLSEGRCRRAPTERSEKSVQGVRAWGPGEVLFQITYTEPPSARQGNELSNCSLPAHAAKQRRSTALGRLGPWELK